ncbi:hypothetical protein [Streptomyces sp. DW26H14]|uniref:hypothetical protein n=1 Tax=Streptomyces sp. DW26H14 TaxID=3435395 RepID=UPI00403D6EB8
MTRENGQAELPNRAGSDGLLGDGRAPRALTAGTLRLFRRQWRGLYGFSLGVALVAALVGCALVTGAFLLSRHYFALTWKYARMDMSSDDAAEGYYPDFYTGIWFRSAPFEGLLALFAVFVLAVLLVAYAVAVRDRHADGGRPDSRELWRRSRPYAWLAFRVQLLASVCAGVLALLAYVVRVFFRNGGMMGIEIPPLDYWSSTPYRLLADGVTSLVVALALFVWFRLGLATAAAVNGARTARAALRRSWALTGGARRRALSVCLLLGAVVVAAYTALAYAAGPVAHPVGLAMLWVADNNPYPAGALMAVVPAAVSLLALTALVVPPVATALALLHTELRPARDTTRKAAAPGA